MAEKKQDTAYAAKANHMKVVTAWASRQRDTLLSAPFVMLLLSM